MCIVLSCAWLFSLSYILAIVHTEFKELNIDMKKCKYHTFIFTKCTIKKHKDRYIPYLFIVVTKKIPFYKRNKSKRKGNICVRMQTVNKCFINVYKVINKIQSLHAYFQLKSMYFIFKQISFDYYCCMASKHSFSVNLIVCSFHHKMLFISRLWDFELNDRNLDRNKKCR